MIAAMNFLEGPFPCGGDERLDFGVFYNFVYMLPAEKTTFRNK